MSCAVKTVKNDNSIKIALDSRKLNEMKIKRKTQMPNMEELISTISRKLSKGEVWQQHLILIMHADKKLDAKTRNLCFFIVTSGEFTEYYRFLKVFHGLAYSNNRPGMDR